MTDSDNMKLCKVSMCPQKEHTDTDSVAKNSTLFNLSRSHFVIEFGTDDLSILVKQGQNISCGQTIAYMRDIPVKSIMKGKITEKNEKYIIGDYDLDVESAVSGLDESTLMNTSDSRFDEINNLLMESQYVTSYIKGYILKCRFAEIATNVTDDPKLGYKKTEDIAEKYYNDADTIEKDYEEAVKKICDKDNIKTECENDNMLGIKESLDNERTIAFNKIMNQYENIKAYGLTSGTISDYMLYDLYLEYIESDDFIYDDGNPYVVELFTYINDFLKTRSMLELNGANIDGMVGNFNDFCDQIIKKHWEWNYQDYYSRIKDIFKYDFFASDDSMEEAKKDDKKKVTLYSKVLNYLKTITKYQQPVSAEEKYKSLDVNTILNMDEPEKGSVDEENEQLLKNLKKIAIMFVTLRKLETDREKTDYYTQYITKKDLNDIFTLRDTLSLQNIDINSYYIGTTDHKLLAYDKPLKKYIGALKSLCDDESMKIRELADRAINWYKENCNDMDSGKIFDKFKEVEWPSATLIKKDNETHDFYFIDEPKTNEELISRHKAKHTEDASTEEGQYEYTEDSLKTEYGITSYMYWVKYFSIATLVNCMLPVYWSTGLVTPTMAIKFPIIFIPMAVIPGRVIMVIGLGICGICPLPMIYFVNIGDIPGSMIPALNAAVDMLKSLSSRVAGLQTKAIKESIVKTLKNNYAAIDAIDTKIEKIDDVIYNLENGVEDDFNMERELRKATGLDSTHHKRLSSTKAPPAEANKEAGSNTTETINTKEKSED